MQRSQLHQQIAKTLAGAQPGERHAIALQLSQAHGKSLQTIYTWADKGGFISGRARRVDAGTRKLDVTDLQLSQVASIIHRSHTEKGRIPMPAHEAIRQAEIHGIIPKGTVSEAYLNAWMSRRKISKRAALAPTPHSRMMAKYPNHVHMIDASQCAQWFIADDGGVAHQRRNQDVYKNKEGDRRKITRLLLVDYYSGAFFVWYTQSETAKDWIEFLYLAWADKAHLAQYLADYIQTDDLSLAFPFCGIPEMVYTDNGSPLTANLTQRVFDNLGIRFETHMPYNPRAKGGNETMQRHWERWFESRLKITPARSLDELNAWAFDCCLAINAQRTFTRHNRTRFSMWCAEIGEIRQLPEYNIYRTFAVAEPETRNVGMDGTIRFKPRSGFIPEDFSGVYRINDVNLWGTTVEVSFCLYDFPRIKIVSRRTGQVFEADPLYRNAAGFYPEISAIIGETYKSPAHTDTQRAMAELADIEPIQLNKTHERDAEPEHFEAPAAVEFVSTPTEDDDLVKVYASYVEAKQVLLRRLGAGSTRDLNPAQAQLLGTVRNGITGDELEALQAQIIAAETAIIELKGESLA